MEERELSFNVGEKVNRCNPLWKTIWQFHKKLNIELTYDPAIPLLGIYPGKNFIETKYMQTYVHCSTIHNSQDMETSYRSITR